ncbi:hypothetical protein QNI16_14685 [Cytophagaceae bacterium YF14B1]|uniref:Uncharacterized protein n=1 Tax=Xanthocytophaga flava TaxID=3048013 RepID=A0AAE3U9I2_9BACT|nr:hypothetical protein [Xanthocytophaga flavus]MDJ1481744.1 hypothetical protein [Xanthocytophaga flavus]
MNRKNQLKKLLGVPKQQALTLIKHGVLKVKVYIFISCGEVFEDGKFLCGIQEWETALKGIYQKQYDLQVTHWQETKTYE